MPAPRHLERLLDHGSCDLETPALLAILFRGAEIDREALTRASQRVDIGASTLVGARPEKIAEATSLPIAAAAVLAAALEVARRLEEAPLPDVIRGPSDVAAIASRELGGLSRERVLVIICDTANRLLRTITVSDGAVDRSLIPVREILNAVLRCDGRAFALAHNHPRGNPEPSDADVAATQRISDAARIVGLRFLGHVVVAAGGESRRVSPGAPPQHRTPR